MPLWEPMWPSHSAKWSFAHGKSVPYDTPGVQLNDGTAPAPRCALDFAAVPPASRIAHFEKPMHYNGTLPIERTPEVLYVILRATIAILVRILIRLMGGMHVVGREHIPRRGGVLIAPNHLSYADGILVGIVLPRRGAFMATSELFALRGWGWLARMLGAFPVEQDTADLGAVRRAVQLLKAGEAVVVFPEGHMSLDGKLQPLQPGVLSIAFHADAPILPVWIEGTDRLMPPRQTRMHRLQKPILIRFGEPIAVEQLMGGKRGRAAIEHGVGLLTRKLQELGAIAEPSSG
ncbi:MAG: lysophospholipid acyltransferase family protein [Chthonomonadales bacterium]